MLYFSKIRIFLITTFTLIFVYIFLSNFIKSDDLIFNNILIDKTSADMLKGSEVDFSKELIGQQFKINNPQSKSSCGCGISFSF